MKRKRELVKLRKRPSRNGRTFAYLLDYQDEDGVRRQISLGHADEARARWERARVEENLRQQRPCGRRPLRLQRLLADHWERTRGQVRRATLVQHDIAVRQLIETIGDLDARSVHHRHGEAFLQARRDAGDAPATINKKLRQIHRVFELAVRRGYLPENPFTHLPKPRCPKPKIRLYLDAECERLQHAARQLTQEADLDWDLLVTLALATGMRRGELLNLTWRDVDFSDRRVEVNPKEESRRTWAWQIKDDDRRQIPVVDSVLALLVKRQEAAPPGVPYVFIPLGRYRRIQKRRQQRRWTEEDAKCPVNDFTRHWQRLLAYANVPAGSFHDLRRTALSRWLRAGMSEFLVMKLAGHADFRTTHEFYLAVDDHLLNQARAVMERAQAGAQQPKSVARPRAAEGRRAAKHDGPSTYRTSPAGLEPATFGSGGQRSIH